MSGSEGEEKRRALIEFCLRPYPASVLVNNALHRGQANARAFELFGAMQALEDPEQFVCCTSC